MYLPSLPALARELRASTASAQLTLTAVLVGLAAGQMLAGPLSDALGRRRPLLIGLSLYAVASLLCAAAPSVGLLIALRFVQGLAGACGIVIATAMVRDMYTGVAAARFFALLMLVSGVAPILAPIFGGQLLRFTSWRGVFVTLTLIGLALLLATWLALPETLSAEQRATGGFRATGAAFVRLFTSRVFIGYVLPLGLSFAAMFAYISGSPFVLQNIYGMSPQAFSIAFAVNALGIVLASQLSRLLAGRVSPARLLAVGVSLSAAGGIGLLAVMLTGAGLIAVLVALFVVVSSVGLVMPNATALALVDHAHDAGSAAGILGVAQNAFGGVAAPLVGIGGARSGVPMALVIAAMGVMAAGSYCLLTRGCPAVAQSTASRSRNT